MQTWAHLQSPAMLPMNIQELHFSQAFSVLSKAVTMS